MWSEVGSSNKKLKEVIATEKILKLKIVPTKEPLHSLSETKNYVE